MIVKQSTARTMLVGPVLDSEGVAKTDEVVGSIKVTKNGTVGNANGSATLTHDHAGKYRLALTASDTDTLGVLEISLNSGTNDMPVKAMNVVPANVYDSLIAGSDFLQVTDTTGSGARTILVTVDDGTDPLENAKVRFTEGANTYTGSTNASGQVTFNLDDATYTVAISKFGYTFAGTTLVVSGDATPTYSMTVVVVAIPSDPTLATLTVLCVDELGAPESGVTVQASLIAAPSGSTGYSFDSTVQEATSDVDGVATLTVVRQATYGIKRGTDVSWKRVTIADAATTTVTSIVGEP